MSIEFFCKQVKAKAKLKKFTSQMSLTPILVLIIIIFIFLASYYQATKSDCVVFSCATILFHYIDGAKFTVHSYVYKTNGLSLSCFLRIPNSDANPLY